MSKNQTSNTQSNTESTQAVSQPSWITSASQDLVSRGTDLANRPVTPYTGEMAAGLSPDQQSAFQNLRNLLAGSQPQINATTNAAIQGAQGYSAAPAQNVSYANTGQLNTDTAALMNPNVQASLQPVLDQIQKSYDAAQKGTAAQATMAGAFGDARQGVEDSNNLFNKLTAESNAAGTAYNTAYNQAQGAAQNLEQGQYGAQTANANLAEQALQRLLTGSQAQQAAAGTGQTQQLAGNQAQQQAGATAQQTQQAQDTAAYNEFLRQTGWDYNTMQALTSALSGIPNFSTTSGTSATQSQTTQPNNWLATLLGAAAGKAASSGASAI